MVRKLMRGLLIALTAGVLGSGLAGAQEGFPAKPIVFVVPFAAGSGTDVITRMLIEVMSRNMKATFLVDNKPGANGQIAAEFVSRAQPDGYTFLVGTNSTNSANQWLFKTLRYDPLRSFAPVGRMTANPQVLFVPAASPFKAPQDLLRFARANPGKLSYGYGNTGGQVAGAMMTRLGKFEALSVPYKSTPQLLTALVTSEVDFAVLDIPAASALMEAGRVRPLAVTTSQRLAILPNLPALRETPDLEEFLLFSWQGLLAPAGTPKAIVDKLNAEMRVALQTPEVRQRLEAKMGLIAEPLTVDEFNAFVVEQAAVWKKRIGEAGIQPE